MIAMEYIKTKKKTSVTKLCSTIQESSNGRFSLPLCAHMRAKIPKQNSTPLAKEFTTMEDKRHK